MILKFISLEIGTIDFMDRRSSIGLIAKGSISFGILPETLLLDSLKSIDKFDHGDFGILFESLGRNLLGDFYLEFVKENNLGAFLHCYIENCLSEEQKGRLFGGCENLQKHCSNQFSIPFEKLDDVKKKGVLDNLFSKKDTPVFKDSVRWIYELRGLILFAFFKSEYGATKILRYDQIPGTYVGEVELGVNDTSWGI